MNPGPVALEPPSAGPYGLQRGLGCLLSSPEQSLLIDGSSCAGRGCLGPHRARQWKPVLTSALTAAPRGLDSSFMPSLCYVPQRYFLHECLVAQQRTNISTRMLTCTQTCTLKRKGIRGSNAWPRPNPKCDQGVPNAASPKAGVKAAPQESALQMQICHPGLPVGRSAPGMRLEQP
ncbi:hypothetical protein NN561_010112 [Cricetulus griseus]